MEFMRILIGKAFGRDISYRKKKSWKLDTLYIELKSSDLEILPLGNPYLVHYETHDHMRECF